MREAPFSPFEISGNLDYPVPGVTFLAKRLRGGDQGEEAAARGGGGISRQRRQAWRAVFSLSGQGMQVDCTVRRPHKTMGRKMEKRKRRISGDWLHSIRNAEVGQQSRGHTLRSFVPASAGLDLHLQLITDKSL